MIGIPTPVEVRGRRKGSLRNYQYGEGATGQIRPHAVIGIDKYSGGEKTGTFTYLYDANGNAIDANGRAITWSSFNKPVRIEKEKSSNNASSTPGAKASAREPSSPIPGASRRYLTSPPPAGSRAMKRSITSGSCT